MTDRQEFSEAARKDVTENILANLKASPSYKVGRFVDQDVLEKTVIHQYGRFRQNMSRIGTVDNVEKARGKAVQSFDGTRFRVCDVPQELSIEEEYFNRYGHGFNSALPDSMHKAYYCPKCGLKQLMDLGVMDMTCPRCGYATPLGQLVKDRYYKKW